MVAARMPRYDSVWVYGIIFCFFYLAFLLWQSYWVIIIFRSAVVGHAAGNGRHRGGVADAGHCTGGVMRPAQSCGHGRSIRRVSPLLLLPLFAHPTVGGGAVGHGQPMTKYVRYYSSPPLAAPRNLLSEAEQQKFKPLPDYPGAITALVYHGVNDDVDGYSVSQQRFAAQMQMLKIGGFSTSSVSRSNARFHGRAI